AVSLVADALATGAPASCAAPPPPPPPQAAIKAQAAAISSAKNPCLMRGTSIPIPSVLVDSRRARRRSGKANSCAGNRERLGAQRKKSGPLLVGASVVGRAGYGKFFRKPCKPY